MRAILMKAFGEADVLQLAEVPVPEPGPGEVRVQLHYAGVNPAEAYIRTGTYAFFKPDLPYVPGFDGAGVVDTVGVNVQGLQKGDRVFVASMLAKNKTGTYAEYVVCDADAVHRLPDRTSFAQGAAIGIPGLTAYRALFQRAQLKPGETVLIHGASGGVGTVAVQLARAHGAYVIGTAGNDSELAFLRDQGVHEAFNHHDPQHFQKIVDFTGGAGVDVIIEMLANVNLERDAEILAMFGRIVVVGNRGSIPFTPRLLMIKESAVLGMALWNATPADNREALAALSASLESGVLRPVVGREYPLAEAKQGQIDILEKSARGKMLLKISEN
ncbi:NADPH:quinone reductase [Heliophilum fasciatum]|uniref:NADPH2:quinone reductase n=1 Tax=Heliophilum fasciatum TaxID=35700 RepID=A0A4R2RMM0_9FIRM|nr:NADPH:quinone reductase [Heliophilum fasciatum]MCW2278573.1 NADPH2:quinone reductase [Heliophilum fasciatum]TCP63527.1 NADPH2:quinone reductase [Heliophilum fasciatum]